MIHLHPIQVYVYTVPLYNASRCLLAVRYQHGIEPKTWFPQQQSVTHILYVEAIEWLDKAQN